MKHQFIDIAKRLYDCIGRLDIDGACCLLSKDVEAVFPFALSNQREQGREAVRARLSAVVPKLFKSIEFAFARFYYCEEDNALIAQLSDVTPSFPPVGIRAGRLFCASAQLKQWAA